MFTALQQGLAWEYLLKPPVNTGKRALEDAYRALREKRSHGELRDVSYGYGKDLEDPFDLKGAVAANFEDGKRLESYTALVYEDGVNEYPSVPVLAVALMLRDHLDERLREVPPDEHEERAHKVRQRLRPVYGIKRITLERGSGVVDEPAEYLVLTRRNRHIHVRWTPSTDPMELTELRARHGIVRLDRDVRWRDWSLVERFGYDELWGEQGAG